ncbi:MAG: CYTH domain-containing protein [Acidimicrobiales bacterium]
MADEVERKFLVPAVPDPVRVGHGVRLRQGYLAIDGAVEVRIRVADDAARLTVKVGEGLARTEVEVVLQDQDVHALWPHTEGRRIEKVRHRQTIAGGLVAEVDLYDGALAGLCTVEVEFPSRLLADAFTPPSWFGPELTGDRRWSNAALAIEGRPPLEAGVDTS